MALQDQPGYIIRMRAKPGQGDRLFELATTGMEKSDSSDRFIIAREDDDPDVLWNMEVFRSDEAKDAYENSLLADELRDEIIDLLAEPPMRVSIHRIPLYRSILGEAGDEREARSRQTSGSAGGLNGSAQHFLI